MSANDPNAGSLVLFKRFGCPPDSAAHCSREWALGRIVDTFFVKDGAVYTPTEEEEDDAALWAALTPWVTIDPEKPEGRSAPTTLTVPLDSDHVDLIVHGTELAR